MHFYLNNKGQIDNLRKEIGSRHEIVSKLLATLNNISNILLLKDSTVRLNNNDLVPENTPSNYNEKILSSAKVFSIQQIVKDKEDCGCIPVSSTILQKTTDSSLQKTKVSTIGSFSENN